ncbi:GTP diphosphokinase [Microbulbifer thermotolerans]|uniref:GTP pyrophosphokinase n=1 Tax=Microbulbifer thermotolerans TaxID=252514 RepID=A0A143HKM2_MICTH|nr:GTP diphosphokinase [Microbulbifer thermotolerans]AMX02275.1 (p)ppGpp synthetase [Microbulbifer thermotolerans]MCX2778740.1 GTP diphosphokinase [Microbulbifer thermotolerans]MCX2784398.1 GTP diphosphokinase [Microbulbifer thermotolerans]MCX2793626.1 GTP diphosphokinase [Microbulbifer thermotolerans]MCX2800810.1 GTP diphosphokinase [Microbulbifer thermotolerans]
MVQVRKHHSLGGDGELDLEAWLRHIQTLAGLEGGALVTLRQAADMSAEAEKRAIAAENIWAEGASSYRTGLEMAEILAELQIDAEALCAAVLYRAVREKRLELKVVEDTFGKTVAKLIRGVLRMAAIRSRTADTGSEGQSAAVGEHSENIRRMLVALVDDVRVALIKLAERTCAIRAAKNAEPAKRRRVAREVADVYAPLAHRLGIGHIKWELEDLSFRYLEPDDYKQIARLLDEKRLDRQKYIDQVLELLRGELERSGIQGEVFGRAKHIYSIWRKMRRKNIGFSQVYDIRAVRILVPTVRDCYAVLGIVHNLWRNIPNEFDDYIASPKENGYRSLHTAVIGPERKVLEVQIRTFAMHEEAEYGVCAHWRYKGTDRDPQGQDGYEQKIAWLRQVLDWHEEVGGNPLQDDLRSDADTRIYVFTPDGHVVDLPRGATPLDFAYKIHTEIGHRCRGAKVDGRIVPLNCELQTANQVEILTGKREAPSRDWLSPGMGYITTSRARAKIIHWFKQQARDQNIADGRSILDGEFKQLALIDFDFEQLARKLNMQSLDDLYAAVGAGDIGVGQVLNAAQRMVQVDKVEPVPSLTAPVARGEGKADVYINGVGNLLTHIARCCNPVPGDDIMGYITLGRGVSIHRKDCPNMLRMQAEESERVLQVEWAKKPKEVYSVEIMIEAYDRHGLLRDITTMLDNQRINVTAMQTRTNKQKHTVDMVLTAEIRNFEELSRVLHRINQLPNVASARRRILH